MTDVLTFRVVSQLHNLVVLHDKLAHQETEFKQNCRAERSRLQALIAEAAQAPVAENSLAPQLQKDRDQLSNLRVQLGRKNRAIAGLQRQLDEVPGRAELAQYQRRFLELYTQGKT
jgi:chromosome segregation ATPase